jgi:hypothetical protein
MNAAIRAKFENEKLWWGSDSVGPIYIVGRRVGNKTWMVQFLKLYVEVEGERYPFWAAYEINERPNQDLQPNLRGDHQGYMLSIPPGDLDDVGIMLDPPQKRVVVILHHFQAPHGGVSSSTP